MKSQWDKALLYLWRSYVNDHLSRYAPFECNFWDNFELINLGCDVTTTARESPKDKAKLFLSHWGRVTHICVGKLTIIDSDNGLSPGRRQAIIWTNAGILLIGPLGTNFSEIFIKILTFSFRKMHLKVSIAKCCPFHLGLNVLSNDDIKHPYIYGDPMSMITYQDMLHLNVTFGIILNWSTSSAMSQWQLGNLQKIKIFFLTLTHILSSLHVQMS